MANWLAGNKDINILLGQPKNIYLFLLFISLVKVTVQISKNPLSNFYCLFILDGGAVGANWFVNSSNFQMT